MYQQQIYDYHVNDLDTKVIPIPNLAKSNLGITALNTLNFFRENTKKMNEALNLIRKTQHVI